MKQRRRPRRSRRRAVLLAAGLLLALPLLDFVGRGLAEDRDLGSAWRALRAPAPARASAPVPSDPAPFEAPRVVGSLLDPELVEVSGLAGSRRGEPVLWAVNDSGNPLRLYALSLTGERLRAYDVAVPEDGDEDWEDLASFRHEGMPYLLIADVGDNRSWRRGVRLWVVEEPSLAEPRSRVEPRWRIDLAYADGAHDCEAVAVDEERGNVLLISKRTAPPILYEAELASLLHGTGGRTVARPLGPVAIPPPAAGSADSLVPAMLHMPTALDLAEDGSAAFVLSYAAGWRFPRAPGETWAVALARTPERLALPPIALAEAAAYAGGALFVTGELDELALLRWRPPLVRFDPLPGPLPMDAPAAAQGESATRRPSRAER